MNAWWWFMIVLANVGILMVAIIVRLLIKRMSRLDPLLRATREEGSYDPSMLLMQHAAFTSHQTSADTLNHHSMLQTSVPYDSTSSLPSCDCAPACDCSPPSGSCDSSSC